MDTSRGVGPIKWQKVGRATDIFLSSFLALIFAPVMILVVLGIKVESAGPAIYKQRRIGQNGRPIFIHKFRTMYTYYNNISPQSRKLEDDRRVTRIGLFLRRTSLDELPQLFDVLFGSLTLVGPRPLLPYEATHVEVDSELLKERLAYTPGLTGWAQVNGLRGGGPNEIKSFEDMIHSDVRYMRQRTLLTDIGIVARTVVGTLTRRNAY